MDEPDEIGPKSVHIAKFSTPVSLVDDAAAVIRKALVVYNDPEATAPESSNQSGDLPDTVLQFWQGLVDLAGKQQGAQTIGALVTFAGLAVQRASREMGRDQFEVLDEIAQAFRSGLETR
jgi:hypothetical protein